MRAPFDISLVRSSQFSFRSPKVFFPSILQVNGQRNSRVMKVNADAW